MGRAVADREAVVGVSSQVEGRIHAPHLSPCLVSLLLPILDLLAVSCAVMQWSGAAWHPKLVVSIYAGQACCGTQEHTHKREPVHVNDAACLLEEFVFVLQRQVLAPACPQLPGSLVGAVYE